MLRRAAWFKKERPRVLWTTRYLPLLLAGAGLLGLGMRRRDSLVVKWQLLQELGLVIVLGVAGTR